MQAYGSYDDGEIVLNTFAYWSQSGVKDSCSAEDKSVIFGYVQSEIERINDKIDDLQEENGRERTIDGTEKAEGEHIGVCSTITGVYAHPSERETEFSVSFSFAPFSLSLP